MNEQIKELMEQAKYDAEVFGEGFSGPYTVKKLNAEKFAQLIVELCVEKVRDVLRDENSDLSYTAADQVQRAIKELLND